LGTCFDLCVLADSGRYRMWFSWRPQKSLALAESADGVHWSTPEIVLGPSETGWEDNVNRPVVLQRDGTYHLWYTGQAEGRSRLGYAASADGMHWSRLADPVLEPELPWEGVAVMCPHVQWTGTEYRLWYSAGEQYEPDVIGHAVSPDGIHWTKHPEPIFTPGEAAWEQHKVTACQVIQHDGWQVMFYLGFEDVHTSRIGLARSRDGLTGWERHPDNPTVVPDPDGWDAEACYKPFAVLAEDRWLLWYNGRRGRGEQIGLAVMEGVELGF